ncbi:MAG TPA: response regulator [Steroidobacter sp.]|jgi:CheY-like chemotaxis protein|nr:response regulator [Steroidobacteraceae bacterium]HLS81873.1 response regulator [Steroidobacter sp.]
MSEPSASNNGPRVLVIEDEMLVRMFAVDALEDAGFLVTEAADAGEALSILEQDAPQFAAIIVDLGLPDRSGDELAEQIRGIRGDVPILIASGRSERELKERFAADAAVAVLAKPYTSALLLQSLDALGVEAAPID